MAITKLKLENYKAFGKAVDISLRPLTVLIGKNSAGKSAIGRLPVLLRHAVSDRALAPLDYQLEGLDFAGAFSDFVHGKRPHVAVTVGCTFEGPDGEISFHASVREYEESHTPIITEFSINAPHVQADFKWREHPDELNSELRSYNSNCVTLPELVKVSFRGLQPVELKADGFDGDFLERVTRAFQSIGEVPHLGAFRSEPERIYRMPGRMPGKLGLSGNAAPSVLAMAAQQDQELLRRVSDWYSKNLDGWELGVSQRQEIFSITLSHPSQSAPVNLVDVGAGMGQVLPLIVQRFMPGAAGLFVVEQPELHLHPAAHGALADLYAAGIPDNRYLIETHSENLVLRLRTLVALGDIAPDQIVIYWVESGELKEILIDESGDVSDWPDGVFSEDFAELRRLREAQKSK